MDEARENIQALSEKYSLAIDIDAKVDDIVHNAQQPLDVPDAAAVHDALCIAYLIDPSVLTDLRHCHVEIGLSGFGEGWTIIDQRADVIAYEKNGYFAFDADRFKFVDILCGCFKRCEV